MIVIKMMGGLGNQMFQYAFARAKVETSEECKLDTSSFRWTESRRFSLPHFNVDINLASSKDIRLAKQNSIINEKRFEYDSYIISNPCYVSGYFQSPLYFDNIKSKIIKLFTLRDRIKSYSLDTINSLKSTNSVSLNVRRGDYATRFSNVYPLYEVDYYRRAMRIVESKISKPHYFVMSDDIDWVKHNINFGDRSVTYLSKKYDRYRDGNAINKTDYEDLAMLSMCKSHIIGNSTFAWWGAYLSQSLLVVSPKKWFLDGRSTDDLLLSHWITI